MPSIDSRLLPKPPRVPLQLGIIESEVIPGGAGLALTHVLTVSRMSSRLYEKILASVKAIDTLGRDELLLVSQFLSINVRAARY
jgi:hypothetical protein